MPDFVLRHWEEQVLFDCRDYVVTADTVEEATKILLAARQQCEEADINGYELPLLPDMISLQDMSIRRFAGLDPHDIVSGDGGITLIDDDGNRERDLIGVPTGCAQLGEPLEIGMDDDMSHMLGADHDPDPPHQADAAS